MTDIRSKEDLRLAYERLSIFKEAGRVDSPKAVELKRQIRRFTALQLTRHIVKDDGMDGYVELIRLPEEFDWFTEEDAKDWFDARCTYGPICSAYDCTGKPFTVWFKVFRRNGHWYAYHSVAFDV